MVASWILHIPLAVEKESKCVLYDGIHEYIVQLYP